MSGKPIAPGATLGILGGGQLGRMLALAAAPLGLKAHVFAPDADSPAFDVAAARTVAAYEDEAALVRFAGAVDVVTFEFENVPAATAELLDRHTRLHPSPRALATAQDRLVEKSFVAGLGLPVAPFAAVADAAGLAAALREIGPPAILKTRRFGYDGKGQAVVRAGDDPAAAFAAIGAAPAILEAFVPFAREVSVVAARGSDGAFAAYDLCANEHRDHILAATRVPAGVRPETEAAALAFARRIADALAYVGVLAVEMFLVPQGDREVLVVNEIAPAGAQFGALDHRGRRDLPVRAACPRRLRLAARRDRAGRPGRDAEPHRSGRRLLARDSRAAGGPPAPLRQGGSPAGPQDGPRDADPVRKLSRPARWLRQRNAAPAGLR